jgi:hypothetical protein
MLVICEIRQVVSEMGAKGSPSLELLIDCRGLQKSKVPNRMLSGVGSLGRIPGQTPPAQTSGNFAWETRAVPCALWGGVPEGVAAPAGTPPFQLRAAIGPGNFCLPLSQFHSFPGLRTMLRAGPGALDWRVRVQCGFWLCRRRLHFCISSQQPTARRWWCHR